MRRGPAALAAVALGAAALLGGSGAPTSEPPRRHVIEMRNFEFSPAHLNVAAGDTVVWINRDVVPHTATDSLGRWDSGQVRPGARWSRVAAGDGEFTYLCTYHPTMRGTLTVQDGKTSFGPDTIQAQGGDNGG